MRNDLLKLLSRNARYSLEDLAAMLDSTEQAVEAEIRNLEKEGLICGYKAVIDWEKLDNAFVSAIIEIKVIPKAGLGFEEVAEKIMSYREVESVYLMSGGYDLLVFVKGDSLQDVAQFVAADLSTIDGVLSTATHFMLETYKAGGVFDNPGDTRLEVS